MGQPVLTYIVTQDSATEKESGGHAVVIVGYNKSNDTYIISDPMTGTLRRINKSELDNTKAFYTASGTN